MNKTTFLKELSLKCNLPINTCKDVMSMGYFLLCDSLKKGQSVNFYGFGKFYVRQRKERLIKKIGTSLSTLVMPKSIPAFKIGKSFKEIIR